MYNSIIIILFAFLTGLIIWGYLSPWLEFKKIGVSLTFKELMSPVIKKSIPLHKDTKRIISDMSIIKKSDVDLTINQLLDIEIAGGSSKQVADATLKISAKGLLIDSQDLKILVLANSDFDRITSDKESGQRIIAIEELSKE
jgi:uncharacterized protein YqfA (UPF0365 family)